MFIQVKQRDNSYVLVNLTNVTKVQEKKDVYGNTCVVFTFDDPSNEVWSVGDLSCFKAEIGMKSKKK